MAEEPEDKGTDTEPESTDPDFKAEAEKWKALARKHEAESKKNATAASRLAELEEQDKTEQQKLADKAAAAEKRAADAELRALRLEVAADKGLTLRQAKRLTGSTKEELVADADELLEDLGVSKDGEEEDAAGDKPKSSPLTRPKEKLRSGSSNDDGGGEFTAEQGDKIAASILNPDS